MRKERKMEITELKTIGLKNFLADKNIEKIYKGKDDYCRCGCGGKYIYDEDKFNKYIENAEKALTTLYEDGDVKTKNKFFHSNYGTEKNMIRSYINIPIFNEKNPKYNQCYCIYYLTKNN